MFLAPDNEERILQALREGDEKAFLEIYETYWYKVFLIAYKRLGDRGIAEELTQDLFLKLWEKHKELKPRKLANYLFVSIKNSVIDHIHSRLVADRYLEYYKVFNNARCETTQESVAFDDLSRAIEAGLSRLPPKTRDVFKLSRLNRWGHDKIAKHLHLSEKTVGYHLTKSLKFMRTYLREYLLMAVLFVFV